MKSVIQDFEDMGDEQIDTLINKLSQIKNKRNADKLTPTKEQKQILSQLRKILKYDQEQTEECDIETTIYNLENVFYDENSEIEYEIDETNRMIDNCKEEIKSAKENIKEWEQDIKDYTKMLEKVEQREVKYKEACKIFKKINKNW